MSQSSHSLSSQMIELIEKAKATADKYSLKATESRVKENIFLKDIQINNNKTLLENNHYLSSNMYNHHSNSSNISLRHAYEQKSVELDQVERELATTINLLNHEKEGNVKKYDEDSSIHNIEVSLPSKSQSLINELLKQSKDDNEILRAENLQLQNKNNKLTFEVNQLKSSNELNINIMADLKSKLQSYATEIDNLKEIKLNLEREKRNFMESLKKVEYESNIRINDLLKQRDESKADKTNEEVLQNKISSLEMYVSSLELKLESLEKSNEVSKNEMKDRYELVTKELNFQKEKNIELNSSYNSIMKENYELICEKQSLLSDLANMMSKVEVLQKSYFDASNSLRNSSPAAISSLYKNIANGNESSKTSNIVSTSNNENFHAEDASNNSSYRYDWHDADRSSLVDIARVSIQPTRESIEKIIKIPSIASIRNDSTSPSSIERMKKVVKDMRKNIASNLSNTSGINSKSKSKISKKSKPSTVQDRNKPVSGTKEFIVKKPSHTTSIKNKSLVDFDLKYTYRR